jgi:hypothetical protein
MKSAIRISAVATMLRLYWLAVEAQRMRYAVQIEAQKKASHCKAV